MSANKTVCTTTRAYFAENAKPLVVTITDADGKVVFKGVATAKEFSTGSMGWSISDKANVPVGPVELPKVQIGLNMTVVGSKELPKANGTKAA